MNFGHVSFVKKSYIKATNAKNSILMSEDEKLAAAKIPHVQKALGRIMISGMAVSARKSQPVGLMGIDVTKETGADNAFLNHIKAGELPRSNTESSVIIGKSLLRKLGLKMGQKLVIQFTDKNGDIQSELLWITSVFSTGSETIDSSQIMIPIQTLQKYLRYQNNEYSFLALILQDQNQLPTCRERLKEIMSTNKTGTVLDWTKTQVSLKTFVYMKQQSGYAFIMILALIVSLGNLNTILMSVMERRREFGMMMALGMKPIQIMLTVIFEAIATSMIGVIFGSLLGLATNFYFQQVGIDMGAAYKGADVANSLFDPIIRSRLYLSDFVVTASFFILLSVLVSIYPALKIRNLNPIDVMTK